jgi:hypothetical protein
VAFDGADSLIEDELRGVRDLLLLALRYRCTFYRGGIEEALLRLSTLRIRWLDDLSFRFGERVEHVPMFHERAILFVSENGSTILAPSALRHSSRLMIGVAEAVGEGVGSRKNIGEPLLALAATLISSGPFPYPADYARALSLSVQEIIAVLGTSRAFVAEYAKVLRPFVQMFSGETVAAQLAPGADVPTEGDLLSILCTVEASLPVTGHELLLRCRESPKISALAVALDVDLQQLNDVLLELGPPYTIIDMTAEHDVTLAGYLSRQASFIRESIRASFRPLFAKGENLAPYTRARDSAPLRLPVGFGLQRTSLPASILSKWLAQWLQDLGVSGIGSLPAARDGLEATREANLKILRSLVPTIRVAVLSKAAPEGMLAARWKNEDEAERSIVDLAAKEGWIDFDRLDQRSCLDWLGRAGFWNADWGTSLEDHELNITEEDKAAVRAADTKARNDASTQRNQIHHSGGTFTIGRDSYGALADRISEMVGTNTGLLQTPTRVQRSDDKLMMRTRGGIGGGTSGVPKRKPEDERVTIGFFGEMIAFAWLKARFGAKRLVNESCWRSLYRTHVYGGTGDDTLGYDFEVQNGKHAWYFEVKATAELEPRPRQMVELGSSEIARAEICRFEGRSHYRILYVTNALAPEIAELFVLPNPRSKEGLVFFTEQQSAGVRLYFPLSDAG